MLNHQLKQITAFLKSVIVDRKNRPVEGVGYLQAFWDGPYQTWPWVLDPLLSPVSHNVGYIGLGISTKP